MLPKVTINYSYIYDAALHQLAKKRYTAASRRGGERFARRLQKASAKLLPRALDLYQQVSGLRWKEGSIPVFVVHGVPWDYSWPVTINVRERMTDAIETLLHELVHQLIRQDWGRVKAHNSIARKYRHERPVVHEHLLAHAILWKAYTKLFGEERSRNMVRGYSRWPQHWRAWQIVREEGADGIIRAYVRDRRGAL